MGLFMQEILQGKIFLWNLTRNINLLIMNLFASGMLTRMSNKTMGSYWLDRKDKEEESYGPGY